MREEKSVAALAQVMDSLAHQDKFPVLLGLDDVHSLFMTSSYHAPDFKLLEAYSLSTPLLMLDYITGRKAFVSHVCGLPMCHCPRLSAAVLVIPSLAKGFAMADKVSW